MAVAVGFASADVYRPDGSLLAQCYALGPGGCKVCTAGDCIEAESEGMSLNAASTFTNIPANIDAVVDDHVDGRTKNGLAWWVDHHQEADLLQSVILEYATRRNAGTGKSIEWFQRAVLKKRFDCKFGVVAIRTYVREFQWELEKQ